MAKKIFAGLINEIVAAQRKVIRCERDLKLAKIDLDVAGHRLEQAAVRYTTLSGRYDRERGRDLKKFGLHLIEPTKSWPNWDEDK